MSLPDKVYASICTIHREQFVSREAYRQALSDCQKHYGYKLRVVGGWRFFEFAPDYEAHKKQR